RRSRSSRSCRRPARPRGSGASASRTGASQEHNHAPFGLCSPCYAADVDRDFGLPQDVRELVALARRWAEDRAAPSAASYEEKKEFPRDLFRQLGEMGLAGIPYDERFGGGGQSFLAYLSVLEEIARAYLALAIGVSVHHLCAFGIHEFGSEDLKERYLP